MLAHADLNDLDEIDLTLMDLTEAIVDCGPTHSQALKAIREKIDLMIANVNEFFDDATDGLAVPSRRKH